MAISYDTTAPGIGKESDAKASPLEAAKSPARLWLLLVAAAMGIWLFGALVTDPFLISLTGYTFAFALFALSINVMLGGVGEVPLGQCIFFGMGGYGVGICMIQFSLPFAASAMLAVVASIAVASLIGWLTLRLTGAYFSIVSWGLTGVAYVAALNLTDVTGGPLGLFGFSSLTMGPMLLSEPRDYFFTTATVLLLVLLLLRVVKKSRFGAAIESVRQNPHLAQSVGVNVFRQRFKAFLLSAPIAALGGALCVPYTQIVTPDIFNVHNTIEALLMVLLGGTQLLVGPVIGAVIFGMIPHFFDIDPNVRILVFSSAIILIMMFAPGGLHQMVERVADALQRRRHG